MPFRFRKSFKLFPGLKLNLSKSGVSTSIGGRGHSVNIGRRGARAIVGIPGSGLSYSSQIVSAPKASKAHAGNPTLAATTPPPSQPIGESPTHAGGAPEPTFGTPIPPPSKPRRILPLSALGFAIVSLGGLCALCLGIRLITNLVNPPTPTVTPISLSSDSTVVPALVASTETAPVPTGTPTTGPLPTIFIATSTLGFPPEWNPGATEILPTALATLSIHPLGTTGQCVDGTYTRAQHRQGACSHHGGIALWWGP